MTDARIVERVARAIWECPGNYGDENPAWEDLGRIQVEHEVGDLKSGIIACALSAISEYKRALSDAGMVVVPREPTDGMLETFHDIIRIECRPEDQSASVLNDREVYHAMLSAAPEEETP